MTTMKGATSMKTTILLVMSLLMTACGQSQGASQSEGAEKAARFERGRYLVTIVGCNDCHTPLKMGPNGPDPDMSRMLSGHPRDVVMPTPPAGNGPWGW